MFIFRVLNTVPYSNRVAVKDVIANVHSYFTCNLLIGLAVLLSWKQFGGKPIECMVPTDFTPAWVQYAENYCWSQDTYFVPPKENVPIGDQKDGAIKVSYYQWMPFFLLFNAACFKLPCMIWKYFASQSGMRVGEILRMASDDENAVPEVKKGNIDALCTHLRGGLRFHKRLSKKNLVPHKVLRFLNVKYSTYYVTFIYFVAKFAFLVNVGLQAKLLNEYVLPEQTSYFGFDVWHSLISGNETWKENGLFPRVSLCDFEVREMGNIQTHTVQCVLLINIFTEKVFLILWAWYLILSAFTACNLFSWLFLVFSETSKEHFISNHLEMCESPFNKEDQQNREHIDRFIDFYLGVDGIFLLQLISQHADVVFTTELIGSLWKSYSRIEDERKVLKRMNRVLPLLDPTDEQRQKANASPHPTTTNRRESRRESMQTAKLKGSMSRVNSLSGHPTSLKRVGSVDELDTTKGRAFDESSDDEDMGRSGESSKRGSPKKSSPKKKQSKHFSPKHERSNSELRRALMWGGDHHSHPRIDDVLPPNPYYSKFHGQQGSGPSRRY